MNTTTHSLNSLFRKRIGWDDMSALTFEHLGPLLEATALAFPFENLRIIARSSEPLTTENLIDKLLKRGEGGLCYELNSMLYFFLAENGFDVLMTRGIVYNHQTGRYPPAGRTHIAVLLIHEGNQYIVDTGFGINLALRPVPLTGEEVSSWNGEFRLRREQTDYGDFVYEKKLAGRDQDWLLGYAFDSTLKLTTLDEPREVQQIIEQHPESPFNKEPLATRLTRTGTMTLTRQSFTQWTDGQMEKTPLNETEYRERLSLFGL
ncbi:arylamine N-acetyltransferase [Paenibacillus herberti]|uniref:Arylamine N-acetyltransferase n=2 Tax=Paenibacillus herberti TaxID=1619309 RepID=A0A229P653_9BACL|nr:arylamine N-acetyltransferase [Paenibacillus herberti]